MILKNKIKVMLRWPKSIFLSIIHRKPNVLSQVDTINYIIENNLSLCRFGDGEFNIMYGMGIKFQNNNYFLKKRLLEISTSDNKKCLVAIPGVFGKKNDSYLDDKAYAWWKKYIYFTKGYWYKYFQNTIYGDSLLTRFYLENKDKSKEKIEKYVNELKKIWKGRNIVIVEGEKTRLGMGNDLFDNVNSIKRILCPNKDAFSKYEKIYNAVIQNTSIEDLIICALGPTATVLAYDLSLSERQALDMGHFDIEYEWFLKGATKEENIAGKDTSECNEDFIENDNLLPNNVILRIE